MTSVRTLLHNSTLPMVKKVLDHTQYVMIWSCVHTDRVSIIKQLIRENFNNG